MDRNHTGIIIYNKHIPNYLLRIFSFYFQDYVDKIIIREYFVVLSLSNFHIFHETCGSVGFLEEFYCRVRKDLVFRINRYHKKILYPLLFAWLPKSIWFVHAAHIPFTSWRNEVFSVLSKNPSVNGLSPRITMGESKYSGRFLY